MGSSCTLQLQRGASEGLTHVISIAEGLCPVLPTVVRDPLIKIHRSIHLIRYLGRIWPAEQYGHLTLSTLPKTTQSRVCS